ncbi:MAG: lipid-A-disaccharide synthase [Hyphomicrobiales bacterium]|nr:lipid-A-disaccharide synthase [Hyphomicrobiales bacterium]
MQAARSLDVFLVAGEESGDQLGVKLMRALRDATDGAVTFRGVGGPAMTRDGLASLFPQSDIAVMGFLPVIARLGLLLRRIRETADAVIAAPPDVLVIIDSPDFTHRVAKRVRKALPDLPVVDYVSPSVWAWRPGRAPAMRAYVDHVLALLPFEPSAHERLGGPACTYVGHPLVERLGELRPDAAEEAARHSSPPTVLILPGSRRAEITRLIPVFAETLARVDAVCGPADYVLPAVDHLEGPIREMTADWPVKPRIVLGEAEKWRAFRRARAALAASGTVTLELALSGVPMVAGYKVRAVEAAFVRAVIQVKSVLLPNLILDNPAVPEFLQENCTAQNMAPALIALLRGGPERAAQVAELKRLGHIMTLDGETPSQRAARIVVETARRR